MLEAEVEALKTLVITSTPSKPGFRRRSTEQLSSCNSCGSVHCMNINNNIHTQNDGKSEGSITNQEREVLLALEKKSKMKWSAPYMQTNFIFFFPNEVSVMALV